MFNLKLLQSEQLGIALLNLMHCGVHGAGDELNEEILTYLKQQIFYTSTCNFSIKLHNRMGKI